MIEGVDTILLSDTLQSIGLGESDTTRYFLLVTNGRIQKDLLQCLLEITFIVLNNRNKNLNKILRWDWRDSSNWGTKRSHPQCFFYKHREVNRICKEHVRCLLHNTNLSWRFDLMKFGQVHTTLYILVCHCHIYWIVDFLFLSFKLRSKSAKKS